MDVTVAVVRDDLFSPPPPPRLELSLSANVNFPANLHQLELLLKANTTYTFGVTALWALGLAWRMWKSRS